MFYLLVCVRLLPMKVRKGHPVFGSLLLCERICGMYVQVCILVCVHACVYKLNEDVCCPVLLLHLRMSFSLSLKLGWQSTSPRDITVSTFHRARLWECRCVCNHAWLYVDAKIRTQDLIWAASVPSPSYLFNPL